MRRYITILMMILLSTVVAQGQIKIGGNVYGGGNHGEVQGSTKVTVLSGDIGAVMDPDASHRPLNDPHGRVFGGARMANVGGNTFVHIDGKSEVAEGTPNYILINHVYGGNDIAGTIGTAKAVGESVPSELTAVKREPADATDEKKNAVDDEFNSYVRISTKISGAKYTQADINAAGENQDHPAYGKTPGVDDKPAADARKVYIGQLFAGGNGDFIYTDESGNPLMEDDEYVVKQVIKQDNEQVETVIGRSKTPFVLPVLDKTYLEVVGGSIVYAYGGGNNVTVKTQNIIHIDNPSAVVNHILVDDAGVEGTTDTYTAYENYLANKGDAPAGYSDLLIEARFKEMGINTGFSFPSSGAYQIGRFFGGNNKAEMSIRPTWNLLAGKVRNLYSGGNKGNMTCPEGLLLEIKNYSTLIVDNLYGGCRMADVIPTVDGIYKPCTNLEGYKFPNELSARTLVRGGHIHNVYGGNDVTGSVYGGNAIGIYTTVYGNVYGGGNGAYPYTDNVSLANDDVYGDLVYSPTGIVAMNAFRPHAEQVSIRLKGSDAEHPTVILGSVFVGGNCASLATKKSNPLVELKMGSYVKVDKVFLGNNGEKMVDPTILSTFARSGHLTFRLNNNTENFANYMEGVAMDLKPSIVFDKWPNDPADYEDWTSWVGSFYCGGNVGSMAIPGKSTYQLDRGLIIFDKFVGGCNNANVEAREGLNPAYEGGVLGALSERGEYREDIDGKSKIKDRLEINLNNMVIQPMRWKDTFTQITSSDPDLVDGKLKAGETYYATDLRSSEFVATGTEKPTTATYYKLTKRGTELEWNTAKWSVAEGGFVSTGTTNAADDEDRRFNSGNVYGGCYNSGHVNGNVVININEDLMKRNVIFAENDEDDDHKMKSGGERRSGVLIGCEGDDVMPMALSVYGAGRGIDTEIWGSTTVNLNSGYTFQIFGGGEYGVVGKKVLNDATGKYEYVYNEDYSSTVNLKGENAGYSEKESGPALAEAEYIYGGGNAGDVCGDCYVNLGNGRLYEAYGGSCNADILGGTEVYIGHNGGFPWVRDNVFGGNDFGGTIKGEIVHSSQVSRSLFDAGLVTSATYVKYIQGRVDSIFGGCYGNYEYKDRMYAEFTDDNGEPKAGFNFPHMDYNSFVHFQPTDFVNNKVNCILGGSEGYPGDYDMNNAMQEEAYVLIDDTQTKDADRYAHVDIFGGGAFAGVGHKAEPGETSDDLGAGRTIVDLYAGKFHNVYGGSTKEGLIGFTRVNVPDGSTIKLNSLFGGSKGYDQKTLTAKPEFAARYCDTYVTCIDYQSGSALVDDGIYGGNQNCRIACDTYINIGAPVKQSNGYFGFIYGAGYGRKTVCGRTNVFMNDGSDAYKVFGGGRDGNSFNFASLSRWLSNQFAADPLITDVTSQVTQYGGILRSFGDYLENHPVALPKTIGTYVNASSGKYDGTHTNDIMPTDEKPMPDYHQTNVHILPGGNVNGYAYGGGYGSNAVVGGTTYVELVGGNVDKDIYGGGEGGPVYDEYGLKNFVAATNVFIESGMARNVYGGGYLGHVGKHTKTVNDEVVDADISESYTDDVLGEANVIIGKRDGTGFMDGIPAIQRNAYGGGEGGSVYGTANLTINNGYIGYRCDNTGTATNPVYNYTEVLTDVSANDFENGGNAFGGGYVVNSYVDIANVNLYGGTIRGSVYGGGEVGPIGRGTVRYKNTYDTGLVNGNARIFKAGQTHVKMYNGHVLRNVFGGGRGKDSWGGDGTKFMSDALKETVDLQCKGDVFGQTEVNIYGGEVGTNEGVSLGLGNVFGGGDEGSVYSAYENASGVLCVGKKDGDRYDGDKEGYYFKYENGAFITHNVAPQGSPQKLERSFTEDCKVLVEPWLQVKNTRFTYDGKTYEVGDYVPTAYLNTLKAKTAYGWPQEWQNFDVGEETVDGFKERGVIIHNAVFAGGNIASGSSSMYANEKTVFGNATASIHDVYNRDFITIGTGHTGGLYGDGNLTFVDGYRELNITNYGTDYYHIARTLEYDDYEVLPKREKDYYEVKYKCLVECTDNEGTTYKPGTEMPRDELMILFTKSDGSSVQNSNGDNIIISDESGQKVLNPVYWKENGVVSTYAGRIMNTIQRADFCGVFGSRMVMKGAQDRVPEVVDYTNYTINRVREVSLNKMTKTNESVAENKLHGNYFGIYSIVNFLGSLTSDVDFHSVRTTKSDKTDLAADGTKTFYDWKSQHISDRTRNNGNCHNQVALASGVYLELTTEKSTGNTLDKKDWGLITGVVELDLINVQAGIGGGFVYAKNEHGVRSESGNINTTLTALNEQAVTKWDYNYDPSDATKTEWQSSGNFIHSSQTIIDDCYNESGRYKSGGVPAHYWYISGQVYVYDQYISAYTGAPNAYSKMVEIPITINAASNGGMTLMDVQPNLYAYYSTYSTSASTGTKLGNDQKIVVNNVTYQLNDPISYWDWNKLPASEKYLFVKDTYVVSDSCKVGSVFYPSGYVMLPGEFETLQTAAEATKRVVDSEEDAVAVPAVLKATKDKDGNPVVVKDKEGNDVYTAFTSAFHSSNNMSHDKGYLLTYNMTNPLEWDKWYTKVQDGVVDGQNVLVKNQTGGDGFVGGPTFYPDENGLYGQQKYKVTNIISEKIYNDYQKAVSDYSLSLANQATFVPAHLVTKEYLSSSQHLYPGAAVPAAISGYTSPAYVCTSTIKLSDSEFIYVNDLMTGAQKEDYMTRYTALASDIDAAVVPAYYCTAKGLYGGDYYLSNHNYRALEAWSSMSEDDRKKFAFNYDALDLLVDPSYGTDPTYGNYVGRRYQYDGWQFISEDEAMGNKATYSLKTPIDYKATYNGATDTEAHNGITRTKNEEYTRAQYESLPNEQRHYAPILVKAAGDIYVVNNDFVHIETPYAAGTIISEENYNYLTADERRNVTKLTFTSSDFSGDGTTYYYCRERYQIGEKTEGVRPTPLSIGNATGGIETIDGKEWVKVGTLIAAASTEGVVGYSALMNYQTDFTIHGVSPMETSTLYVGRNANIKDLSTEKIITVIYKYDYEESDARGMHITPVSERHVVNIHITFKSGVPIIEDINEPAIVLPGTNITLRTPNATPGAYDILGGGWELFEDKDDAGSHTNGTEYDMASDEPLYWYQDGFYLAYYAKTYLGKTYSNAVPVHVANYHDLKKVMDDENHLYVDYDRTRLKRDSKIYINDYSSSSENGLDLFKDFYDLSLLTTSSTGVTNGVVTAQGRLNGQKLLNNSTETGTNIFDRKTYEKGVKAGKNLDFFLHTDIDHSVSSWGSWTPIASGTNEPCFNGTLHGDGHTISGLDNSLFKNLCGSVYNLGVTGSFSSAGVVDEGDGYVENCWINTTGTPDGTVYAVFGKPGTSSKQIVNCYYQDRKGTNYKSAPADHGVATAKSKQAFYNGEVAFDLNGFYLYKRYNDNAQPAGTTTYQYWLPGNDIPQNGTYARNEALCSSGYNGIKYVEERFGDDGDFRFADGSIPTTEDERHYVETVTDSDGKVTEIIDHYCPVWPDDYLYFGQKLTYGYSTDVAHQDVPTAIVKDAGRLVQGNQNNRVYRAPAYYRSKAMGVAHFNPDAYLAAKSADGTNEAYPRMTAIDFAGHEEGFAGTAFKLGSQSSGFYPPMLDDDGLTSIVNEDETRNLLVYAPAATAKNGYANQKTCDVLNNYFVDPKYSNYYIDSDPYRLVRRYEEPLDGQLVQVYGHVVQGDKKATNDHLLVDKQDFNAPIAYTFDGDHLMWYQRIPEDQEYVDRTKGWQGISLPFTSELVTTHQKGEITHFYSGSEESKNGTETKIGHEYWLREFTGISTENPIAKANFTYPQAPASGDTKTVTNTFLWDYYYKGVAGGHDQKDKNTDTYQEYYRNKERKYEKYAFQAGGTPYLLGLPGVTYYEFDLSGSFEAKNTADKAPDKLVKQVITFASNTGASIDISDDEVARVSGTNGYTFKPNYMNQTLTSVDETDVSLARDFVLNTAGNAYEAVVHAHDAAPKTVALSAFRPYFTTANAQTRTIVFGNEQKEELKGVEEEHGDPTAEELNGGLRIWSKKDKIFVESTLSFTEDVRVVTPAGITVASFAVKPGKTVEVKADFSGIYVVHTLDGKYIKKLSVKK